ncbi:MAG: NifU family protein [Bacteroidales bacterium]
MVKKIEKSIEEVRPYLQADGGDIALVEVTSDFIVKVKLKGACGSCPFSIQTLKLGVEDKLKRDVPEVKEVVSV